ncbi:MBL fold metallo-hydrolase, partial [Candidatus Sumerlaeota bacterium]|nr:MBL fold metallo-hydrolase [Candidatus Sumerlaeota bacterium]
TNCVVVGERELYVIDPGTPFEDDQKNLERQLADLMEPEGKIAAVLLTHSHRDHIGAAQMVRQRYGAPIWAHETTASRVDFPIDRHLADGEIITIAGSPDWRLRCIHTPGHDPGHLAYLEETTRVLACGDMIANGSMIVVSPKGGGDMTQYLESLERLLGEDISVIIPGHGQAIQDARAKIREYIDHRLWREDKIKKAWESGATAKQELLAAAYDDVPREVWPWAEHSLDAHLARLGFKPRES